MKRTEALIPLSHEHHQALFIAHELRRAEDANDKALEAFRHFWTEHGLPHFRVEEEILMPMWRLLGSPDDEAMARVAREHLEIRTLALELTAGEPSVERMGAMGELLHDHVRYEERELFAAIEDDLDAEALARVGAAIAEAESAAGISTDV